MKHLLLFFAFVLSYSQLAAQSRPDSITFKKGLSPQFMQNGMRIMPRDLVTATKSNPAAYQEMKKARVNNGVASVLGSIGGFLIGLPLGTAIGGGEPDWGLAGVGAGFVVAGIPFSSAFTKRAKNAIKIYNGSSPASGMQKVDFKFGPTGTGMAFKLTF